MGGVNTVLGESLRKVVCLKPAAPIRYFYIIHLFYLSDMDIMIKMDIQIKNTS